MSRISTTTSAVPSTSPTFATTETGPFPAEVTRPSAAAVTTEGCDELQTGVKVMGLSLEFLTVASSWNWVPTGPTRRTDGGDTSTALTSTTSTGTSVWICSKVAVTVALPSALGLTRPPASTDAI